MKRLVINILFILLFLVVPLGIQLNGSYIGNASIVKAADQNETEYVIISKGSGKVLTIPDSVQNDTTVVQSEFSNFNNQVFHLIKQKDGSYYIVALCSGKALAIKGASRVEGAAIIQTTKNNEKNQQWKLTPQSDGVVKISSVRSKLFMVVSGTGVYDGDYIQQSNYDYGDSGLWIIQKRSDYLGGKLTAEFKSLKSDKLTYKEAQKSMQTSSDGHIYQALTKGIKEVGGTLLLSHCIRTKAYLEPLFWGTENSTGSDKYSLPGTLPSPGWAGEYGKGRVLVFAGHELFFAGNVDGQLDNDAYRINVLNWLLKSNKRIVFSNGHKEYVTVDNFSPVLAEWALENNVTIYNEESIEAATASNTGVLIIGNATRRFTNQELIQVERWVRNGGSLCVLGLGWSWSSYKNDLHCDYAPVNQFGQIFGWKACEGILKDIDAPNDNTSKPSFSIKPYSSYLPQKVLVLSIKDETNQSIRDKFIQTPEAIFVLEGDYTGFHVRTTDWQSCEKPKQLLELLDQTYKKQMQLTGNVSQPYQGEKLWYISVPDEGGSYYMYAGNPIVMTQMAGADVIQSVNRSNYLGWAIPHEMGHVFMLTVCNDLLTYPGTTEPWANVFNVWTHDGFQWSYGINKDIYQEGNDYLADSGRNLDTFKESKWIFLGCIRQLWEDYGWEGTQKALTIAAEDAKKGRLIRKEEERLQYLMETLNQGYGRDLSEYYQAWGIPGGHR